MLEWRRWVLRHGRIGLRGTSEESPMMNSWCVPSMSRTGAALRNRTESSPPNRRDVAPLGGGKVYGGSKAVKIARSIRTLNEMEESRGVMQSVSWEVRLVAILVAVGEGVPVPSYVAGDVGPSTKNVETRVAESEAASTMFRGRGSEKK